MLIINNVIVAFRGQCGRIGLHRYSLWARTRGNDTSVCTTTIYFYNRSSREVKRPTLSRFVCLWEEMPLVYLSQLCHLARICPRVVRSARRLCSIYVRGKLDNVTGILTLRAKITRAPDRQKVNFPLSYGAV